MTRFYWLLEYNRYRDRSCVVDAIVRVLVVLSNSILIQQIYLSFCFAQALASAPHTLPSERSVSFPTLVVTRRPLYILLSQNWATSDIPHIALWPEWSLQSTESQGRSLCTQDTGGTERNTRWDGWCDAWCILKECDVATRGSGEMTWTRSWVVRSDSRCRSDMNRKQQMGVEESHRHWQAK